MTNYTNVKVNNNHINTYNCVKYSMINIIISTIIMYYIYIYIYIHTHIYINITVIHKLYLKLTQL